VTDTIVVHETPPEDEPSALEASEVDDVADALEDIADTLEDKERREETDDAVEHALRHERVEERVADHAVNGGHMSREEVASIAETVCIALLEDVMTEVDMETAATETAATDETPVEQTEVVEDVTVPPEIEERTRDGAVHPAGRDGRRLRMGGRRR